MESPMIYIVKADNDLLVGWTAFGDARILHTPVATAAVQPSQSLLVAVSGAKSLLKLEF